MLTLRSTAAITASLILVLWCAGCIAAANNHDPQNGAQLPTFYTLKRKVKQLPAASYFLGTYSRIAEKLISNMDGVSVDHFPPKEALEIIQKLDESVFSKAQAKSIKAVRNRLESDRRKRGEKIRTPNKESKADYFLTIALPQSFHGEFNATKAPLSPFYRAIKLASNEGNFQKLLELSIKGYGYSSSLVPTQDGSFSRFQQILSDDPEYKNLDPVSQRLVKEAFGNLPTEGVIKNYISDSLLLTAAERKDFIQEFVKKAAWASDKPHRQVTKALNAEFTKNQLSSIKEYNKMLRMKDEEQRRQQIFADYLFKSDLQNEIIKIRLDECQSELKTIDSKPFPTKKLRKWQTIFKFEVQFTAIVDGFEYMKQGLFKSLKIYREANIITGSELKQLDRQFHLSDSRNVQARVSPSANDIDRTVRQRLDRFISPISEDLEKFPTASEPIKVSKAIKEALSVPTGSDILVDKDLLRDHIKIYEDRLKYQVQMQNFIKFTRAESRLRKQLMAKIEEGEMLIPKYFPGSKGHKGTSLFVETCSQGEATDSRGNSCVFVLSEHSEKRKVGKSVASYETIAAINSKELLKMYKEAKTPVEKQLLIEIVSANTEKLVGSLEDIRNAHSLVDYEMLHDHSNRLAAAVDASNSKDLNGIFTALVPSDGRLLSSHGRIHLSPSRMAQKLYDSKVFHNTSASVYHVGKAKLASTIVKSLATNDLKSLPFISNQTGTDGGRKFLAELKDVEKHVKSVAQTLEKAGNVTSIKVIKSFGKGFHTLAKLVGKFTKKVDIGLNALGIIKDVARIFNPDADKLEQMNAISDVITKAEGLGLRLEKLVEKGVSKVAKLFSLPAPPAWVSTAIVWIGMKTFGAVRHVLSLDSKVKLRGFEKFREGLRSFFGMKTSLYILNIIKAKDLNTQIVVQSVEILENHHQFKGTITPTKSIHSERRKDDCLVFRMLCDYYTYTEVVDNKNSFVDLRNQFYYFKDRSSPEVGQVARGYEIFCFPGSKTYQSHRISDFDKSVGFLCYHAIGVQRQSYVYGSQFMLIDLEDGDDTVYSNYNDDIFIVGKGNKNYHGGGGSDAFLLVECSESDLSALDGEDGSDTLVFDDKCASYRQISVKSSGYHRHNAAIEGYFRNNFAKLENIEVIIGRAGQQESIYGAQTFESIDLRGGVSSTAMDFIQIDGSPKRWDRDMTINVVGRWTTVLVKSYGSGKIYIVLPYRFITGFVLILQPADYSTMAAVSLLLHFEDLMSVTLEAYSDTESRVHLRFSGTKHVELRLISVGNHYLDKLELLMQGYEGTGKILKVNLFENIIEVSHLLNCKIYGTTQFLKRIHNVKNIFNLCNGMWSYEYKGAEVDDFVVHLEGQVEGKISGSRTLFISTSSTFPPNSSVTFDFQTGALLSLHTKLTFEGTTKFHGAPGISEHVWYNCEAQLIDSQGGSSSRPDFIYLNQSRCENNEPMTIVATGWTQIQVGPSNNRDIAILVQFNTNTTIEFSQTVGCDSSSGKVQIFVPIAASAVEGVTHESFSSSFTLHMENSELIHVNFVTEETCRNSGKLDISRTEVIFGPAGFSTVETRIRPFWDSALRIEAIHELQANETSMSSFRRPLVNVTNVFIGQTGNWTVIGSEKNDRFIIGSSEFVGNLDGGDEGNDTVVLHPSIEGHVEVVLGKPGFIKFFPNSSEDDVVVERIEIFVGRQGESEDVTVGPETILIDTKGGAALNPDIIRIPNFNTTTLPVPQITIIVESNTTVLNSASAGEYLFVIESITNANINLSTLTLTTASNIMEFHIPFTEITSVNYEPGTKILEIQFNSEYIQVPLAQGYRVTVQFLDDSTVVCDISLIDNQRVRAVIQANQASVKGIIGAENVIYIGASIDKDCYNIMGANKRDAFVVRSIDACIDQLHGGNLDTENTLIVSDTATDVELIVDLGPGGSVIVERNGDETYLIKKIQNIHSYHGQNETRSEVFIACDTVQVRKAQKIRVTDYDCQSYNVDAWIAEETEVLFEGLETSSSSKSPQSPSGSFTYHFELLRSFDVSAEFFYDIQMLSHVFLLPMNISDIQFIEFKDRNIVYSVGNQMYRHKIYDLDGFVDQSESWNDIDENDDLDNMNQSHGMDDIDAKDELDEIDSSDELDEIDASDELDKIDEYDVGSVQFFANPRLVTAEGFIIQVTPFGQVFFTLVERDPSRETAESIISMNGPHAKRLQANIIIHSTSDFFYFASSSRPIGVEEENQPANDVISNFSPRRSHLVGDGGNVVYLVNDLQYDVHIYPFILASTSIDVQIIDITSIIASLAKTNDQKYIPSVRQDGSSLVIFMEGHQVQYPAEIFVRNASFHLDKLRIKLRTYLMRFEQESEMEWRIKPVKIVLPRGTVAAITTDDMEAGQEIILSVGDIDEVVGPETEVNYSTTTAAQGPADRTEEETDDTRTTVTEYFINETEEEAVYTEATVTHVSVVGSDQEADDTTTFFARGALDGRHKELESIKTTADPVASVGQGEAFDERIDDDTTERDYNGAAIARRGKQVIFTTLAACKGDGASVVLIDEVLSKASKENNHTSPVYTSIQISIAGTNKSWILKETSSETVVVEIRGEGKGETVVDVENIPSFTNILEIVEDEILKNLPEIPRSFRENQIWFHGLYWGLVAISLFFMLVVGMVVAIVARRRTRVWNVVSNQSKDAVSSKEMQMLLESAFLDRKANDNGERTDTAPSAPLLSFKMMEDNF